MQLVGTGRDGETAKASHTWTRSAAEPVTVSVQPLQTLRSRACFQSGTQGHLEAITGIIYNHSEVTTQKCRLREGKRRREEGRGDVKEETGRDRVETP